jgi:hypothetical protein
VLVINWLSDVGGEGKDCQSILGFKLQSLHAVYAVYNRAVEKEQMKKSKKLCFVMNTRYKGWGCSSVEHLSSIHETLD